MLAIDVRDLGAEVGRRDELIDRGVDEHARRVDSRLVAEDVQTNAWLRRLHRNPADLFEVARQGPQLLVLETGDLDPEQVAELHQDLMHRSVARAFPDAVDARGEDLGA